MLRLLFLFPLVAMLVPSFAWSHGISEEARKAMIDGGYLQYVWLGAEHMITGYDHLLFLFGVIFFLTKPSEIVKFVTAFGSQLSVPSFLLSLCNRSHRYTRTLKGRLACFIPHRPMQPLGRCGS